MTICFFYVFMQTLGLIFMFMINMGAMFVFKATNCVSGDRDDSSSCTRLNSFLRLDLQTLAYGGANLGAGGANLGANGGDDLSNSTTSGNTGSTAAGMGTEYTAGGDYLSTGFYSIINLAVVTIIVYVYYAIFRATMLLGYGFYAIGWESYADFPTVRKLVSLSIKGVAERYKIIIADRRKSSPTSGSDSGRPSLEENQDREETNSEDLKKAAARKKSKDKSKNPNKNLKSNSSDNGKDGNSNDDVIPARRRSRLGSFSQKVYETGNNIIGGGMNIVFYGTK
jgi:hypothetical protein